MRLFLVAMWVLLAAPLARADDVPCLPRDLACPLPADLNSDALFQARVGMELHRVGGPRPSVLIDLLAHGEHIGSAMWGNFVLDACEENVLSCGEYLDRATERAAKAEPRLQAFLENQRRVIAKVAVLDAMGKGGRHALYQRALAGLAATQDAVTVYRTEAAKRAMREAFLDLIPTIQRKMGGWSLDEQREVARYIAVAEAKADQNPARALAQLVRRGAAVAAESASTSVRGVPIEEQEEVKDSSQLASMALDALRRLGDRGALAELKEAFELYKPLAPRSEIAESRPSRRPRRTAQPPEYLGTLGARIVEAIGDFGDREFERRLVGARTYWDKVNETEQKLVKDGRLRETEMVSQ